jgi:hypothetical protein
MFTRMNSVKSHDVSPNGNQQSPRWMGRAFLRAFKANPPLVIDADAVLAFSVPTQRFKRLPGNTARS